MEFSNSKKQGNWGLGTAIAYYTSLGFTVCVPLTDSQSYDLIIDYGRLERIQVRTTTSKSKYGIYEISLRSMGGRRGQKVLKFDRNNYEALFAVTPESSYLIPSNAINTSSLISLGKKYEIFRVG
jgi:hypothetical protein